MKYRLIRILFFLVATATLVVRSASAETFLLSGTVFDPTGGSVAGATLTLESGEGRYVSRTDADGTYRLELPPGTYRVAVEAPGFATRRDELVVGPDAPLEWDVWLELAPAVAVINVTAREDTLTATKTDTPPIETPQSISIISRAQTDVQAVNNVAEAVRL